ncbi:hypothetical protein Hte_011873 [Hypoxylon texense]
MSPAAMPSAAMSSNSSGPASLPPSAYSTSLRAGQPEGQGAVRKPTPDLYLSDFRPLHDTTLSTRGRYEAPGPYGFIYDVFERLSIPNVVLARPAAPDRALLDRVVICVACGGVCRPNLSRRSVGSSQDFHRQDLWDLPILIKAAPGFWKWTEQPWTAKAYHRNDEHWILEYPVRQFAGGPLGFDVDGIPSVSIDTQDESMYLPIHRPCFELAKQFCRYQSSRYSINFRDIYGPDGGVPTSVAHLYEIWQKRALQALPFEQGPLDCLVPEPTRYANIRLNPSMLGYISEAGPVPGIQEYNPLLNATYVVIEHLLDLHDPNWDRTPSPWAIKLTEKLDGLDDTVLSRIEKEVSPLDLSPSQLQCTRVLTPSWWKRKLFSGAFFPWLFDLNVGQVDRFLTQMFGTTVDVDEDFDWELLCRTLAMPDVFAPYKNREFLVNRRRIWDLFASARLLDTPSGAGEPFRYAP